MAATKEEGVSRMKERKKVSFGEDHDSFKLEAERDEPRDMVDDEIVKREINRRRIRTGTNDLNPISMFCFCRKSLVSQKRKRDGFGFGF